MPKTAGVTLLGKTEEPASNSPCSDDKYIFKKFFKTYITTQLGKFSSMLFF